MDQTLQFHTIVHSTPDEVLELRTIRLRDQPWSVISLSPEELTAPLPRSFDEVLQRLEEMPRMFIEPDGSFVWVSESLAEPWQIDGQLNDGSTGLISVEIKGRLRSNAWDQLLRCLGWPAAELLFQLVREGVFMTDQEFRRYCRLAK